MDQNIFKLSKYLALALAWIPAEDKRFISQFIDLIETEDPRERVASSVFAWEKNSETLIFASANCCYSL